MAGRRVHLFVTEELITELGHPSAGVENFIEAVKIGPHWVTRQGLCQKALQSLYEWRKGDSAYPPYICYLSLFVLAAGKEGDFAPNAYYPRLRTLLGEESRHGQYPSFHQMVRLWDDLERWSNKDRAGELGIFYNSIAGNWFHVGIPIAQTLLTEHERRILPQVFAQAALDPSTLPSDEELAILVKKFGQDELRPHTLSLLGRRDSSEDDLRGVLIETIVEELNDWDGMVSVEESQTSPRTQFNGALRLCCQLDEIACVANLTLRCSSNHDLPAGGLLLNCESTQGPFFCEDYGLGWSTPLKDKQGGEFFNASSFNWSDGIVMQDRDQGWLLRLQPAPVRVFVTGGRYGIHGLVEVRRLPQATKFYLAAKKDTHELVKKWGESSCRGFKEIQVLQGLPPGWSFFSAEAALGDEEIRRKYPMLALPITTRLFFRGGIRVSQGNQFFKFASPCIVLEGNGNSVELYCDGIALKYNQAEGCYELPEDTPSGTQLTIEARHGSEAVKKLSLYLEEEFPAFISNRVKQFDHYGLAISREDDTGEGISGSVVNGYQIPPFDFNCLLQRDVSERIFYIGSVPGQVINYPSEPLAADWFPVWAITMHRTGKAEYCGISLSKSEPDSRIGSVDRKKLQLWKDLLWLRRKKIKGPSTSNLRNLWLKYQEVARHV